MSANFVRDRSLREPEIQFPPLSLPPSIRGTTYFQAKGSRLGSTIHHACGAHFPCPIVI